MEFTYRDQHYIRNALKVYLKKLEKISEDDDDMSEDEFSEIQDDVVNITGLLSEVEQNLRDLKENAGGGAKLYTLDRGESE